MGVAGFFKKIKNAVKTVTNKIDNGIKKAANAVVNVGKNVINTGAKVVSKIADVASNVASVVAPVGTLMSLAPGPVGVVGKVVSGVGNLVKYGGKGVEWLANKVDEKIPDNPSSATSSGFGINIANKASSAASATIDKANSALSSMLKKPNSNSNGYRGPPSVIDNRKALDEISSTGIQGLNKAKNNSYRPQQSQPDVIVNNYYNRGPRRDYIQRRHPSNPYYNVRDIGPRRLRQPPIMNPQQPIDIQRRNYYTRPQNYYSNPNYNAAISW